MGGALCRPLHRRRCRDQSRKPWRERPRCARWKWPRACPEGSLTPWLSVSVSVPMSALPLSTDGGELWPQMWRSIVAHFVRTIWSRWCGKSWSPSASRSARNDATDTVACARARSWHALRRAMQSRRSGPRRCAGHHALDARSVLGTVQGSSLRSARARARPSGLDGACAQLADWQLRDGRRCDDVQLADLDY